MMFVQVAGGTTAVTGSLYFQEAVAAVYTRSPKLENYGFQVLDVQFQQAYLDGRVRNQPESWIHLPLVLAGNGDVMMWGTI